MFLQFFMLMYKDIFKASQNIELQTDRQIDIAFTDYFKVIMFRKKQFVKN